MNNRVENGRPRLVLDLLLKAPLVLLLALMGGEVTLGKVCDKKKLLEDFAAKKSQLAQAEMASAQLINELRDMKELVRLLEDAELIMRGQSRNFPYVLYRQVAGIQLELEPKLIADILLKTLERDILCEKFAVYFHVKGVKWPTVENIFEDIGLAQLIRENEEYESALLMDRLISDQHQICRGPELDSPILSAYQHQQFIDRETRRMKFLSEFTWKKRKKQRRAATHEMGRQL